MRRRSLQLALLGGLTVLPGVARADVESRFDDRWFFSLYAGSSRTSAGSLTHDLNGQGGAVVARNPRSGSGTAGGWDVSFWPNDWVGFGFGGDYASTTLRPRGYDSCISCNPPLPPGVRYEGFALQVGAAVRLGVPLRYVHPYLGLGPGLTFMSVRTRDPDSLTNEGYRGDLPTRFGARTFAGVNGYVSRDLRVFAEYHWFVEGKQGARLTHSGIPDKPKVEFRELRVEYAVAGVAWSPPLVRKLSPRYRWAMIGGIAATTVFMTGAVALAQGN